MFHEVTCQLLSYRAQAFVKDLSSGVWVERELCALEKQEIATTVECDTKVARLELHLTAS